MRPTLGWMSQAFDEFNRKYFGGKLTLPRFSTRCGNEYWGYYMPDGNFNRLTREFIPNGPGTIYLNGKWEREERDWESTLIHEMIHMYINEVLRKYPVNAHGKYFKEIADRINQDGFEIYKNNEKKDTDVYHGSKGADLSKYQYPTGDSESCLICFINQPNDHTNKMWVFKAEPDRLQEYIDTAKLLKPINGADEVTVYYCYSNEVKNMPSSSTTLEGFGARGPYHAISLLNQKYGAILGQRNFRLFKKIDL